MRRRPGYSAAVVAAFVRGALDRGNTIPADYPDHARAASMAAHPAGKRRPPELTAADGTEEPPLPTTEPED